MNQLVENLKLKAWKQAKTEIGEVFENAVANRAQDLLIELVVEECIKELSDNYDMNIETGNFLREHFGVE